MVMRRLYLSVLLAEINTIRTWTGVTALMISVFAEPTK